MPRKLIALLAVVACSRAPHPQGASGQVHLKTDLSGRRDTTVAPVCATFTLQPYSLDSAGALLKEKGIEVSNSSEESAFFCGASSRSNRTGEGGLDTLVHLRPYPQENEAGIRLFRKDI